MIIISVSPIHLINEMSVQLVECQLWLKGMSSFFYKYIYFCLIFKIIFVFFINSDITEREANSQCVQKAFTALRLLKEIANEMPLSLNIR